MSGIFSYEQKCDLARRAKIDDIWVSVKTGREVIIKGNNFRGVMLLHESGRRTIKKHHYFAYDYYPTSEKSK